MTKYSEVSFVVPKFQQEQQGKTSRLQGQKGGQLSVCVKNLHGSQTKKLQQKVN